MAVAYHKKRIVHSVFQNRNIKCVNKPSFPRPGHKYFVDSEERHVSMKMFHHVIINIMVIFEPCFIICG